MSGPLVPAGRSAGQLGDDAEIEARLARQADGLAGRLLTLGKDGQTPSTANPILRPQILVCPYRLSTRVVLY